MLWSKSLLTGVKRMDGQNKELCRRIDLLLVAAEGNKTRQMLDFLDDYMQRHFEDEHILHKASDYPGARVHQSCHESCIAEFQNLKKHLVEEDEPYITNAINEKVVGWVQEHIAVHDREFALYLKSIQ